MRKTLTVILFALLSASYVHAQLEKVLHQSFDLNSISNINLELYGEYEIEKWAGNSILTETTVQIYDATPGIFKHFIKDGRYGIEADLTDGNIQLKSTDNERVAIRRKNPEGEGYKECYEFVKLRIFVPDDFKVVDQTQLVRDTPSEATTSKEN
ncbi:MAG: hypothetical protein AAGG75_18355 [Bacteroidota bacterium]